MPSSLDAISSKRLVDVEVGTVPNLQKLDLPTCPPVCQARMGVVGSVYGMRDRRPFQCPGQRSHARRQGRQRNENPENSMPTIPTTIWGVRVRL